MQARYRAVLSETGHSTLAFGRRYCYLILRLQAHRATLERKTNGVPWKGVPNEEVEYNGEQS